MNKNKWLKWETWFYSLVGGIISSVANAGSAYIAIATAHASGVDIPTLNLKQLGIISLTSAISGAYLFLKQSPLPVLSTTTEVTATLTTTETKTNETQNPPVPPAGV